jgi:hypothetical protein
MEGRREVEVAFVAADRPEETFAALRAERALGHFALEERPTQTIVDTYLDTPDGELAERGVSMRRRLVDGEELVTVKARDDGDGRLEIEEPWSDAVLRSLEPHVQHGELDRLEPIQERATRREVRAVVGPGGEVAELALDRVAYRVPVEAVLYEVELEAAADGFDVEPLALLLERHPGLARWPHSKLRTGQALAEAPIALGPGGTVTPATLRELERRLGAASAREGSTRARSGRRGGMPPHEQPPYGAYATLVAAFAVGLGLASRASRPDRELTPVDLVALGLATFKASRTVSRDRVGSFVREPFVEETAYEGEGETPAGTGMKRAVGELVTCTRCVGTWVAAGLATSLAVTPRFGRLLVWTLDAAAVNDFLQAGFAALTHKANEIQERVEA